MTEKLKADRVTPIAFYPYPSSTRDRFYQTQVFLKRVPSEENKQMLEFFNDLKLKCLSTPLNVSEGSYRKDVWDNKVVIECLTEEGETIYVGYYDVTLSIGRSVKSERSKPYYYMQNTVEEKV